MVTLIPALPSDCWIASARPLSPVETVIFVVEPSGLPASFSSCFAFSTSPVAGIFRVSRLLAVEERRRAW